MLTFSLTLYQLSRNPVQQGGREQERSSSGTRTKLQGLGVPPTLGSLPPPVSGARPTPERAPEIQPQAGRAIPWDQLGQARTCGPGWWPSQQDKGKASGVLIFTSLL